MFTSHRAPQTMNVAEGTALVTAATSAVGFGAGEHLLRAHPGDQGGIAAGRRLASRLWKLRRMLLSIPTLIEAGYTPLTEAALVKHLGTSFAQNVPVAARQLKTEAARAGLPDSVREMLDGALPYAPPASIRGGTRETLRGTMARGPGR